MTNQRENSSKLKYTRFQYQIFVLWERYAKLRSLRRPLNFKHSQRLNSRWIFSTIIISNLLIRNLLSRLFWLALITSLPFLSFLPSSIAMLKGARVETKRGRQALCRLPTDGKGIYGRKKCRYVPHRAAYYDSGSVWPRSLIISRAHLPGGGSWEPSFFFTLRPYVFLLSLERERFV